MKNKININRYLFLSIIALNILMVKTSLAVSVNISNPIASSDFSTLIENVLLWVLGVAGAITLLMLITGGVLYVTSAGDEQKVATAKKMINWTILGLMIILSSYAIITVLDSLLT